MKSLKDITENLNLIKERQDFVTTKSLPKINGATFISAFLHDNSLIIELKNPDINANDYLVLPLPIEKCLKYIDDAQLNKGLNVEHNDGPRDQWTAPDYYDVEVEHEFDPEDFLKDDNKVFGDYTLFSNYCEYHPYTSNRSPLDFVGISYCHDLETLIHSGIVKKDKINLIPSEELDSHQNSINEQKERFKELLK